MSWQPGIGDMVVIYPYTDRETTGQIIADPARRWAILTNTGSLEFVDTEHLAATPDNT